MIEQYLMEECKNCLKEDLPKSSTVRNDPVHASISRDFVTDLDMYVYCKTAFHWKTDSLGNIKCVNLLNLCHRLSSVYQVQTILK